MDNATFDHLSAWCDTQRVERHGETEVEADALRGRIVTYLESQEIGDAEYALDHGWPHVAALVE